MNNIYIPGGVVLIILSSVCCKSNDKSGFVFEEQEAQQQHIDTLIRDLPSYEDIVHPMKEAGIQFQAQLLNLQTLPVQDKQSIIALQTGVLLSDMAYCRYFEQVHKAMFLSSQIEDRLQALNIPTGKIQQIGIELETHMYSRDTVMSILSDAYTELNDGLMKTKRTGISALIMTGAWIESSRLMLADNTVSDDIVSQYWKKHRDVLSSLIPLIDAFESGIPENLLPVLNELSECHERNKALEKIDILIQPNI
ncbi:MAG: hypothetical protein ACP5DZ_06755 [Bacteroidales bacterium]